MKLAASLASFFAGALLLACTRSPGGASTTASGGGDPPVAPLPEPTAGGPSSGATPSAPTGAGVIGLGGIAAWDALADKDAVTRFPSLYLHQSVGQDLEDGAADAGRSFAYYGPSEAAGGIANGLHGGLFADVGPVDNGKPLAKMNVVRRELAKQKGKLKVLSFSFGYADVMDTVEENGKEIRLDAVMAEYKKLVSEVRAAGVRFVHVTPPLVFDPSTNAPKMRMRAFMLETFKSDVIFDLTDVESLDGGKRCEKGGVWHICQANRSTAACPSKGQGIDTDGQGHLCSKKAAQLAKALLYAIYVAGK
ncbi:MAG: hypothetical protein JST00_05000 [Deltaproteobacteria bacterium]|nr:hypothetical protein [Deltaproteobacteria bacterium]